MRLKMHHHFFKPRKTHCFGPEKHQELGFHLDFTLVSKIMTLDFFVIVASRPFKKTDDKIMKISKSNMRSRNYF